MPPRAIVIVCDSLGVGELPDAKDFGDEGSNTLGHVLAAEHPQLPTLIRLGLLHTLPQPASSETPRSAFDSRTRSMVLRMPSEFDSVLIS